jgi:predicted ATPase
MLTRLRLKNIKAWGEQLWSDGVGLSNITLLLGPNSAGKTSLLQIPLLLKQTFDSPDRFVHLNLGGQLTDLVDLGSYESLVHRHDTKREVGVGLSLDVTTPNGTPALIDYSATFTALQGAPVVKRLEIASGGDTFSVTRQLRGGYRIAAPGYTPRKGNGRVDARRSFQPERSLAFSQEAIAELGPAGDTIQDLSLLLRQALDAVVYLGPLREHPERTYLWSGVEPRDIGKRGELAVHALLASDNTRVRPKPGVEGGRQWLVDKVSQWLSRLDVADELVLERHGRSRHYELVVVRGKQRANLMDVGFGVSQVLPMIVLSHIVPQGATIVAEQPELHLHPRAQGGLAELMADVARERGVQFLVETHSEHLFRRLQTLMAHEVVRPDDCALYFVDNGRTGAQLDRLQVDAFGRVANWPKHFFGDALGETERQTRRMLERAAAVRKATSA